MLDLFRISTQRINFTFISAQAHIVSYMEGYIIANKSCNSSCPQFSWLGDECITWEMVIYILEVVGASEERGARGTHATEVGSSSLACLSRALRSLQRVTPKRLLRGLAIRQSLMVLLKFRYKEKKNPKNV